MFRTLRASMPVVTLGLLLSQPAGAITYGFVDSQMNFPNVGAFLVQRVSDGKIFPICSGTLIAETVFLTAAHCTEFYLGNLAARGFTAMVSFDSPIGFGDLTNLRKTNLIVVTQVVTNPSFSQAQSD